MAQRRQKLLDEPSANSIAQKARRAKELATISEIADANLTPSDGWRTVLPEHIEAIKTRLIGGDTLGNVCRGMGLDRANVLRHFHENPALMKEHLAWRATGAHALYDDLLELPFRTDMSAADKLLYYKIVSNYAPKINRDIYTDSPLVNQSVTINAPVIPNWFLGNVVDGQLSDDSEPTI